MRAQSHPLRGRCPAGQRGRIANFGLNQASTQNQTNGVAAIDRRAGGTAPPSALPGISPARGEIGCRRAFAKHQIH
ncbi:MAG: hypothetical protein EOS27_11565 [Mesorhizobium sp.]|nr:MAG: hypothetical protein EOS27_11565 [Mesorhizobium sp.]